METLPGGTRVFTSEAHRFGSDALLLCAFATFKASSRIADLGAGCGILLLGLADRGHGGAALALEQDPEGAALVRLAKEENNLPNLEIFEGDLREYVPADPYDLVVSNPPYFAEGPLPADPVRAAARHEVDCSLAQLSAAATRLLKEGGRFFLCYTPSRLAGLFSALEKEALTPKRLQFVRKGPNHEPSLVLLEARKGGGEGLRIMPDRLLPPGSSTIF